MKTGNINYTRQPLEMNYENQFSKIGISDSQVIEKIHQTFETMFFDPEDGIYGELGDDMGFLIDTGNNDARTEGMSYGMMMALQLNQQVLFDKLWLFAYNKMLQKKGKYEGYFAWSVSTEGKKNSEGPAPDGEEYFAMALFFAAKRWGDKEEPFNYSEQARTILRHCIHQPEITDGGDAMWNPDNHYIKFVPEVEFSDPSYHLPHFYELFAQRADDKDRSFWKEAAKASREYILESSHPKTGMAPEYSEYSGKPKLIFNKTMEFYSDAYRVAMNVGLDTLWFGPYPGYKETMEHLQTFLDPKEKIVQSFMIDGRIHKEPAMHPQAMLATTAAGSIACEHSKSLEWIQAFWEMPLRKGERRYYDNCLYLFSLLILSGVYSMY